MAITLPRNMLPQGLRPGSPIDKIGDPFGDANIASYQTTFPIPKECKPGDFVVVWMAHGGTASATPFSFDPPGMFTWNFQAPSNASQFGGTCCLNLFTHFVREGEPGTQVSVSWPTARDFYMVGRAFRYVDSTDPFNQIGAGAANPAGTSPTQSATGTIAAPTVDGCLVSAAMAIFLDSNNGASTMLYQNGLYDEQHPGGAAAPSKLGLVAGVIDLAQQIGSWGANANWNNPGGGNVGIGVAYAGQMVALNPAPRPDAPALSIAGLNPNLAPGSFSSWTGKTGTTVALASGGALKLTVTSGSTADAQSGPQGGSPSTASPGMMPVAPNTPYVGSLQVVNSDGWPLRSVKVRLDWYDASGTFLSQNDGPTVTEQDGTYVPATCMATAPGTAAYVQIEAIVSGCSSGEVHWIGPVTRLRVLNSFDAAGTDGTPLTVSFPWTPSRNQGIQAGWVAARQRDATLDQVGWWNGALEVWQATPYINVGEEKTYSWPASSWVNDHTRWQLFVGVVEDNLDQVSWLAGPVVFTADDQPTVLPTGPFGNVASSTPPVTWVPFLAASCVETGWQVRIASSDQYLTDGFDPATSTVRADSGVISSAAVSWTPPALRGGAMYRAYVRVRQTGNQWSDWEHLDWYAAYGAPAAPTVAAVTDLDPVTGAPRVKLTVTGHDLPQLLSAQDAGFEGAGTGSWAGHGGASVARSTAQARTGAASLAATFAAGTGSWVETAAVIPITAGQRLYVAGWIRAATTGRALDLGVDWSNSGGGGIGSSSGPTALDSTTGWTRLPVAELTPPGGAVGATVYLENTGAGGSPPSETHYLDDVVVAVGPPGLTAGLEGTTYVDVYRYDAPTQTMVPVRFAQGVQLPWPGQGVILFDYEAPPNPPTDRPTLYQAQVYSTSPTP